MKPENPPVYRLGFIWGQGCLIFEMRADSHLFSTATKSTIRHLKPSRKLSSCLGKLLHPGITFDSMKKAIWNGMCAKILYIDMFDDIT